MGKQGLTHSASTTLILWKVCHAVIDITIIVFIDMQSKLPYSRIIMVNNFNNIYYLSISLYSLFFLLLLPEMRKIRYAFIENSNIF